MSPKPLRRPPEPGEGLLEVEFRGWTEPVYCIQDAEWISAQRHPEPRYRFDAPGGEYAVLYANDTEVATFNESYAEKRKRVPVADAERHLVRITPRSPLPLVDLTDDRTLSVLLVVLAREERAQILPYERGTAGAPGVGRRLLSATVRRLRLRRGRASLGGEGAPQA